MYPALQDAQAPVPEEQARQVEGVPAAQHTPPPHVPLEHSVWESQAAPGAFGVMQRPVLEMTWPWGQLSGCTCGQVHVWGGVLGKGGVAGDATSKWRLHTSQGERLLGSQGNGAAVQASLAA